MSFDQMRRQLERKVQRTAENTAKDAESRLRRDGPSDTGNMRQQTTGKARTTVSGARIDITVDTPYAHIVAHGQRPHAIGQPGQFLYNSRTGFAAVGPVQHPGALGNNWWDDTIRDLPDIIQRNWRGAR